MLIRAVIGFAKITRDITERKGRTYRKSRSRQRWTAAILADRSIGPSPRCFHFQDKMLILRVASL